MKKYFISSDIHSFYDEWMSALNKNQFDINNQDHIIVVLGDLWDRGNKPKECLQFVNNLPNNRKILIRGNHEDLLEEALIRKSFYMHDEHNGTSSTIRILSGLDANMYTESDMCSEVIRDPEVTKYLDSLVDYYELENNIFVHGWIPCNGLYYSDGILYPEYNPEWRKSTATQWKKSRWLNGMNLWNQGVCEKDKTIWCGHWHASWGHCNIHNDGVEFIKRIETYYIDPSTGKQMPYANYTSFKDKGIVALDACTVVSGFVNCEVLELEDNN